MLKDRKTMSKDAGFGTDEKEADDKDEYEPACGEQLYRPVFLCADDFDFAGVNMLSTRGLY